MSYLLVPPGSVAIDRPVGRLFLMLGGRCFGKNIAIRDVAVKYFVKAVKDFAPIEKIALLGALEMVGRIKLVKDGDKFVFGSCVDYFINESL